MSQRGVKPDLPRTENCKGSLLMESEMCSGPLALCSGVIGIVGALVVFCFPRLNVVGGDMVVHEFGLGARLFLPTVSGDLEENDPSE